MPDASNDETLLPDIPEQPVPESPEVIADEVNIPNFSRSLDEFVFAEKLTAYQKRVDDLEAERTMLWQRKLYAFLLFALSFLWLTGIFVILWFVGKKWLEFSDAIVIFLIGTTTANVLGLFYIVARWLFPQKSSGDKISKSRRGGT